MIPDGSAPGRQVRVGCSGWQYASWRGRFYPEGIPQRRWLELYARRFDTVEVNSTFYRLPRVDAVAGWVRATPPEFRFAVKVSRYVTHFTRLTTVADSAARLWERLAPMLEAGRLGPVLWQLPERFTRDEERLARALDEMPAGARHCLELRHPSWFCDDVWALLAERGVAAVVGDDPRRPLPPVPRTADFAFVRLHHGTRGRRGNYSDTELRAWAATLRAWRRTTEVWAYFNNDWEGFAPRNAARLARLVAARG